MADTLTNSDVPTTARYFVYFRCWPGFTDGFPYEQFDDLPDGYEEALAVLRSALAKEVWQGRAEYRERRQAHREKTRAALVKQSKMVLGPHENRSSKKDRRSLCNVLYGPRKEWFLGLATLVGWHNGRRKINDEKTAQSFFFSPRIWIAEVGDEELAASLVNEVEKLRGEGSSDERVRQQILNLRYGFVKDVRLPKREQVSAQMSISRLRRGEIAGFWEDVAKQILPRAESFINCWQAGAIGVDPKSSDSAKTPGGGKSHGKKVVKQKRSTQKGEADAKLIAALTRWHKYKNGHCNKMDPVGNNELARLADVSIGSATNFFKRHFECHKKYKIQCQNKSIPKAMEILNSEIRPSILNTSIPTDRRGIESLAEDRD